MQNSATVGRENGKQHTHLGAYTLINAFFLEVKNWDKNRKIKSFETPISAWIIHKLKKPCVQNSASIYQS